MKTYNTKLNASEARFNDLWKLVSSFPLGMPGSGTIPGAIGEAFKKLAGGLPLDCKLTINQNSLLLEASWFVKQLTQGFDKIEIPFSEITRVSVEKDNFYRIANMMFKTRLVVIETRKGTLQLIETGNILQKCRADEISESINNAIKNAS